MTVTSTPGVQHPLVAGTQLPITGLVLSDGQQVEAGVSAMSLVDSLVQSLVLERQPAGTGAEGVLTCDWHDEGSVAPVLAAVSTPWLLVVGAGERLVVPDTRALAEELEAAAHGPLELEVDGVAEVRLHPTTADAVSAIGSRSGERIQCARIVSAAVPAARETSSVAFEGGEVIQIGMPRQRQAITAPSRTPLRTPETSALSEQEHAREALQALEERRLLEVVRGGRDVCWIEDDADENPLVTIRIATYNRGQMVVDRAINSALAQTYTNIEVLVVGDACDEATAQAVMAVTDPRVRFVNLPQRGTYPDDPVSRWMVAGTAPMNAALFLARGAWLAPCDDDDELTPDHVEVLLRHAKRNRLEMIHSKARCEVESGMWQELGREPLEHGHVSHGSVMYSLGLRFVDHSATSWKLPEPADWNMWRRMRDAGVRIGYLDEVTYVHYLEGYKRVDAGQVPTAQRLHLGCGPNKLPGWVNVDIEPEYQPDVLHDLSTGLPAGDSSLDVIYSEHVFEHFPLETGLLLLSESVRTLRPGGVIRIAMPELTNLVDRYLNGWRDQAWIQDPGFAYIDTACRMLNVALREWGHTYVYDEEDLRLRLQKAGFTDIRRCEHGQSSHPDLRGLETREDSLLIMEAVAP